MNKENCALKLVDEIILGKLVDDFLQQKPGFNPKRIHCGLQLNETSNVHGGVVVEEYKRINL